MKVLVVGGGGREHALCWKLDASDRVSEILCAPGNGGIASLATCVDVDADDVRGLQRLAWKRGVDLVIVGPEVPLAGGLVDRLEDEGIPAFGPTRGAARIESSKAFAKELMRHHGIPTADFRVFDDADRALDYVRSDEGPLVVKADGLAAGKGALVCRDRREAREAVRRLMVDREFGPAGDRIVCESFLRGEELSLLAITDGRTIAPFDPARDYKAIGEGGTGPNTGGMGAYSPVEVEDATLRRVEERVLVPTVHALASEESEYRGILYAGLMLTPTGPKVLEFNCRFGDPEAQVLLMRLRTDLVDLVEATLEGRLGELQLAFDPRPAVTVVLASEGYPGRYETGREIRGVEEAGEMADVQVFHAGTRRDGDRLVTAGGRVLAVTALGDDLAGARARAYRAASRIEWDGRVHRRDIARDASRARGT